MKIGKLLEKLKHIDPDAEVCIYDDLNGYVEITDIIDEGKTFYDNEDFSSQRYITDSDDNELDATLYNIGDMFDSEGRPTDTDDDVRFTVIHNIELLL